MNARRISNLTRLAEQLRNVQQLAEQTGDVFLNPQDLDSTATVAAALEPLVRATEAAFSLESQQ